MLNDHIPPVSANQRHLSRYTRQLDFLPQFELEFRHIRGSENVVADALSQMQINSFRLKLVGTVLYLLPANEDPAS